MAAKKKTAKPISSFDDLDAAGIGVGYQPFAADAVAPMEAPAAPAPPGMLRRVGDTAVQFGQGAVTGVKMMSDIFGANNAVSSGLSDVNQALDGLLSATAQNDKQKVAQIMQEAEGKGWGEQIVAGLKAAGVDPVGLAANALGTSLPTMATMLIPGAGPAAVAARMGAGVAMGAGQGVGGIKGQIYDETKRKWLETGATPEQAEAKAQEAAAYGGANTDQMAIGGVLGMGSVLGAERALGKVLHGAGKAGPGMLGRVATTTAAETGTEMLQGGQEKFATNTALNRQGFDVDPMSGVIANATLEGAAAAPMGAIAGIPRPAVTPAQAAADTIRATETLPESGPMTRASNAATEAKAQAIEAGAPLVDEQATAEPTPEPVDDPVRDQILALPDGARQDALRAYAVVNRTDVAKGVQQYNRKLLDRLLAQNQPAPVLGERLTDTDMGSMLGGSGMASNADPVAGMLGGLRDSTANAMNNVEQAAQTRPPMPASDAARMLDEARNRGLDLAVAEHPAGGFVLVPPNWVTPDMAAHGEARLNETIARMQQADAAPVERAPRTRTEPVDLSLPTDPVQNYMDTLRAVNTPAARAYVRDFDAGRITPADVQQRMVAEKGKTPDQRIVHAAAEAPAQTDPVADRLARAAAQGMATPAPTDILNPAGEPFKTRMAADRAAKKTPGAVVPVEGGFVVRPQEPVNVQDVPQAPEVSQAAPVVSPPGQATQAVGAQPAGSAAGVPAAGTGAVEAAGLPPRGREGYDTPVTLDAASLKALVEKTRGTPLVDKPEKLEAWRNGTAKTDPAKFPIELAITPDGRLDVNDGRHRIALAAERGETVEAFIDGKDAQYAQQLVSQPSQPPGATSEPQAPQAVEASPQPAQAGAAPAADAAPGSTAAPAPAGAPAVRALTDGAPAENTGAQAAPAAGAQAATADETREQRAKRVASAGQVWTRMGSIGREALVARAPGLNPIQRKRIPSAAWDDLHTDIQRKLADTMDGRAETGGNQVAAPAQQAQAATENVAGNSAGQDEKSRRLKSVADMNRMSKQQLGAQIDGVVNGHLNVLGDPNATKQGRALMAAVDEARRAGATNEEIAAAATGSANVAPAAAELSLDDQLKQVNDELADQGQVQNARTRAKRDQIRTAIAERDFPAILKAVEGDVGSAEAINQALQFAGDEPKAKVIERVLKNRGISDEYRQRWAERLMGDAGAQGAAPTPSPGVVNIPPVVSEALENDLRKQKARAARLRTAAAADGTTLDEKRAAQLKVTAAEATLRQMRTKIFDAEDAVVASVKAGNPGPFSNYADLFPGAEQALVQHLLATPAEPIDVQQVVRGAVSVQKLSKADTDAAAEILKDKEPAAAPAKPTPKKKPSADQTRAKADLMAALADLGDILGKNTRMNITPEQEVKLLPVLTRVLDAAFRLGYHKFKDAAKFALDQIRANLGDEAADALTLDHLQGAYIAMAGGKQGTDTKRAVIDVETKAEIEAHEAQTDDETQEDVAAAPDAKTLTESLYQAIGAGNMPKDNPALKKLVESFDGKPADPARMKQAQEELETAIAMAARDIVAKGQNDKATFDELLRLYESQPSLNIRTSTSVANQAYSTPAPLAYLASKLAGINPQTRVHEPTGGTGMLLIGTDPKNAVVNELNDLRVSLLKEQGFNPTQKDAAIGPMRDGKGPVDAVITNPPFGSVKGEDGKPVKVKVDGYNIGQIDHLIAAHALATMKDDGRAVLILGANKAPGGLSTDDRIFFNWLYSHYNVVGHFEVEGDLYARQGAGWPVRVIVINGREKSSKLSPVAGTIQRADNWDQVYEQFNQILGSGRRPVRGAGDAAGRASDSQARQTGVPNAAGAEAAGTGGPVARAGADSAGNVAGAGAGTVADRTGATTDPVGHIPDEQRLNGQSFVPPGLVEARPGADVPANRPAKPAGTTAVAATPAAAGNEFQTHYVPRSARKDEGVLIPSNMAQPTQDALNRLEDAVGDIDEFARKELGYESTEALHNALMGLQVDSVATAIYQIKQNKAVVIADQTGIGKGRQAASIIRWAARNGMIPVFVSVKPSLFTDMYGDLADIGTHDVAPFILNSTEWVSGADGEKLFANKPSAHRAAIQSIVDNAALPQGRNALFMTYSQINTANLQRQALMALAPNAVFVLDESHNAAGDSGTGDFMISVLKEARGVTYLSATYAKRPDNMPLYFKTDIGDAAADSEGLADAMAAGGLPLQTVVSNNLVKAGQMFRRERSYDGVSIASTFDTANRQLHERLSDEATEALRAIVSADKMFHSVFVKSMDKALKAEGSKVQDNAGNQVSAGVQHTEFSSVVHNFVRQMLLGLKAQTAADEAIAALKRGEKPIIAVENTMGSFLSEYAAQNNINQGDSLGAFDYRTVLSRALERSRVINVVLPTGDKSKQNIPLSQLDPITRKAYDQAQAVIDRLAIDIPVSPIDWMRAEIARAGFSVAEITGRDLAVDYSNPRKPVLSAIDLTEQRDKVASTRRFNGGELDALILNVAGSTGISLHASEKFADQRQRHMIVAQAAGDINIFMQMLGRVHRTGQVRLPKYTILSVDLPTEKRPTAVLSRKMKSLNANTSSNTESATSVKTADILNKYGDQIVNQYLADNIELARQLGVDDLISADGERVTDDIARKATGRLALQPIEVQRAFYEDVEAQYDALIEYLNKTNQNDLEPRTFDFDAKEVRTEILFDGPNKATPFGEDAVYGEYSIKAQGMAMKPEEIQAAIAESLQGKTGEEHARDLLNGLLQTYVEQTNAALAKKVGQGAAFDLDEYAAFLKPLFGEDGAARMMAQAQAFMANGTQVGQLTVRDLSGAQGVGAGMEFLRNHAIGKTFRVEINSEPYNAVITNVRSTHKTTGNPFSLSKIQITIAVNGALRSITVPATQFKKIEVSSIAPAFRIETLFKEQPANQRETAKIVTGNLLAAYGEIKGARGTIISFTKADGVIEQGILLPKLFDFSKNTQGDYRLRSGADALKFLQQSTNKDIGRFGIATRDGQVRVLPRGDGVQVRVPKSKTQGARYFLDKNLIAVAGDFVSSANAMVANVDDAASAEKVLDLLMDKQALYAMPSMADEAKSMAAPAASFSRATSATSTADSNARLVATQMLVDGLKAKWKRAPEIIVARNMQDDQIPQRVRDHDATLKSQGATGEARGFIYKGKVYLLSDQLNGARDVAEVLFHEALGHHGLRGVFGDGLTPILKQIAALRKADVQAKADEYGLDMAIEKQRLDAAEEVLAEMAQMKPELGYVKRAIAAIRNWLRANVPGFSGMRLTDADIIQAYIIPARGWVERGNETATQALTRSMSAAFSLANNTAQTAGGLAPMSPSPAKTPLYEAFRQLARFGEAFQLQGSSATDLADIAQDMQEGVADAATFTAGPSTALHRGTRKKTLALYTKGLDGEQHKLLDIFEADSDRPFVVIGNSEVGQRARGAQAYQIAFAWAHNNGKTMRPDPAGLTAINRLRRSEAMISSALRFGTTRHLEPHADQYIALAPTTRRLGAEPEDTHYSGNPQLHGELEAIKEKLWTPGDDAATIAANVQHLIEASAQLARMREPALRDLEVVGGALRNRRLETSIPLGDLAAGGQDATRSIAGITRRSASTGVGHTTAVRYAVTASVARAIPDNGSSPAGRNGQDGGDRRSGDAAAVRAIGQTLGRLDGGAPEGLSGILYSRTPGDQTQTDAFKRWFAGSKVVDAQTGKPLVVYHGTHSSFTEFKPNDALGGGMFFSPSPEEAGAFTGATGSNIMPVYLSAQKVWPKIVRSYDEVKAIRAAKSKGYDAIRVRDDQNGVVNWVVFDPTQVKSATGNNGNFDPNDPDIRFSRAGMGSRATDAAKAVGDTLKSITVSNVKQRAGFKLTDYLGIGLQALGRRQIVDIYGDLVPLAEYNRLVQQMEADKNEGGAEADQLVTRWAKLQDESKLADLMHDATLAQIDPAEDFVEGDDKGKYLELRRKYNLLSDEAKKVYADTRDSYKAHHAKVRSAIKERIERSEIKGERKAALLKQMDDEFFAAVKGVYFPLARFGQYAVTVKGPDGKVESVSRAETKAEADALRNGLLAAFPRNNGFTVSRVMLSKEFVADRDAVGRGFMTELYQVLDKQDMDAVQRAELEDTLGQLYLSSLPDLSWAKHGIHRKGTPGFSQDARRAYAQNMFHGARYLAKLRYSDLMQEELSAMQKHVDEWRDVEDFDQNSAQRVVDEMNKRHESLMNPKSNALSTALTSFGFIFHLGLSPASALVNLSQTALVAYPIMGAKWGYSKASAALLKASAEAAKGKNDITASLNDDERAAYDEAVRAGTIDVTMAHDLAGIAQGEDAGVMWKIRPVMRYASFLFHHAERFNRQVTFVAAYRLAREAGADHKAAFEQATKATYDGHFDYSAANKARIMQGNVAKVLLLFKQYGQNMVYTLARNAQQAMKAETPEARTQARKALGGLLATHAAAAGVLGLPMVTTLLAAASMIGGDDDEPWDAKVALQNMLADTFGQKPAEVLAHGLSRLTPWDISGRVGLDKLIFPDIQEGLEGQRLGESAMAAALGPVAGIGINVLKGLQDMSQGQYARGLESMLPAALRGPLKAVRYQSEGVQDKTGIVVKDEVSPQGVVGQFLGFSPSEVRNATEGKSAVYQQDRALGDRRQELLTQAAKATMDKDAQARSDAMKEIEHFNQKNPTRRITPLNVLQSVRNRQKRIDQSQDGVYLPKSRRDAMEAGRFALGN